MVHSDICITVYGNEQSLRSLKTGRFGLKKQVSSGSSSRCFQGERIGKRYFSTEKAIGKDLEIFRKTLPDRAAPRGQSGQGGVFEWKDSKIRVWIIALKGRGQSALHAAHKS